MKRIRKILLGCSLRAYLISYLELLVSSASLPKSTQQSVTRDSGRFSAVLCLIAVMVFQQPARAGVVAWWRFENGTAGQAATGDGTILDSSDNGLNGSPVLGPVYASNVPAATIPLTGDTNLLSMSFDGSQSRVFIPDYSQLALTNSLTLEAYIFVRVAAGGPFSVSQIIFRGDDRGYLDPYTLYLSYSHIEFQIDDEAGNRVAIATPDVTFNVWHHVAGTLDGATGTMRLYVDGILMATRNTTVRPFANLTGANPGLGIGNLQSGNYAEYFNGLIDEARISDKALSPDEFLIAPATPPPALRITAISKQGNDIRVTWTGSGGQSNVLQSTKSAAIASYNTNFTDISPVIVLSGVGASTTNYLDPGVAYAPVLSAPSGNNVTTSTVPSTVDCSGADTRGITDSLGRALPIGSLLMLGSFSISEPTIQSNFFANNVAAIMSNFTPYATSFKVGDGTSLPASWSVTRSAAGFDGQQIYLLAIDKPTFAAATHLGIYTAPSWVFPSGGGTNTIDLADVTDFVIGAQSGPLTINLPVGGATFTFDDTARLNVLPGRILFYRVRLAQ